MQLKAKCLIHNKFEIEIRDAKTKELKQKAEGYNIILDSMYTYLCGANYPMQYIHFGTGSGTPVATRTSLFTFLGAKSASVVEELWDINNNINYVKKKCVLTSSENNDAVLTEIGLAQGSGSATLTTHALIKDAEGNPISITKTSTDEITIYATVYLQVDMSNPNKMFALPPAVPSNGGNSSWLTQVIFYTAVSTRKFNIYLGKCCMANNRSTNNGNVKVSIGYKTAGTLVSDAANKKIKSPVLRFEASECNGDIFEIGINTTGSYSTDFSQVARVVLPLAGVWDGYQFTNITVGTGDGATKGFNLPNNNILKDNAVIYINGVAKTKDVDFTLNYHRNGTGLISSGKFLNFSCDKTISSGSLFSLLTAKTSGSEFLLLGPMSTTDPFNIIVELYQPAKPGKLRVIGINDWNYSRSTASSFILYGSNDGTNWTQIANGTCGNATDYSTPDITATFAAPATAYKYFKIQLTRAISGRFLALFHLDLLTNDDQLIFTTAPVSGDIITADYKVEYIPKDSNHALDIGIDIQFGEGI